MSRMVPSPFSRGNHDVIMMHHNTRGGTQSRADGTDRVSESRHFVMRSERSSNTFFSNTFFNDFFLFYSICRLQYKV